MEEGARRGGGLHLHLVEHMDPGVPRGGLAASDPEAGQVARDWARGPRDSVIGSGIVIVEDEIHEKKDRKINKKTK